jgi:hypothetical protein
MRIFVTPSQDTTLYQRYPTNNAGLDEIIEVGKVATPEDMTIAYSASAARGLISFTLPTSGYDSSSAEYFLNLKIANAEKLPINQQLSVQLASTAWTEGSGYFYQQSVNAGDGATWRQATSAVSWSTAGGDIVSSPSKSISLSEYPLQDLRINISSVMQPIISQTRAWYGLIIKYPSTSELDANNKGNIKFFSKQTHTVHAPTLEIAWDGAAFSTGSLKPIPNTVDLQIVARNPREAYSIGTREKVQITVRDKYPVKNFDSVMRYKNKYYLPATSYFSIVDAQSDTVIIPFDEYSKISCDSASSFFILDTSPLYKNRYYKVRVKIYNTADDITYIDNLYTFLVK